MASAMAWLPPTGTGQPTVWASVASMMPAPAATNDGIREIVWAATPVNNARASSPRNEPHAGVPWRSAYGAGSLGRHVALGCVVLELPADSGLRRDVDTPDQLAALADSEQ